MICAIHMFYRKSIAISRVPYVTREEKDKSRRAEADVCLPLCDLSKGNQGGLANELEIALANINMRREEQKEKKAHKSSKTGEAIIPASDKENKTQPPKKRAKAK
jgi:hypothetical protein